MRAALVQMTSGDDPEANLAQLQGLAAQAVAEGAGFVLSPEVSNCLSTSRTRQRAVLRREADDPMLAAMREFAARRGVWVLLGSLAVTTEDAEGRFANRSILIDAGGGIAARYDKIHMFDVAVSEAETYRESDGYRPGDRAVLADTPFGKIGMTVCYDLRFPHLFRDLARAGAEILTVPSAFSPVTGAAHWEPLLRARAIECGAWVLAPAQTGTHPATRGKARSTHGHSLAVDPWGRVLADGGTAPGVCFVDLDRTEIAAARRKIPSLTADAPYADPV
ncbi:nitrilase/cyanide hydratase and apolipoprotein N-acyltransferase [Dinoroseobacter shibae DFL 12 = DSM 16493]|jgi:predicted amidohydrolase|uniref:Nitrilase/cyanide hydratase and apolipoprotein N-acyltransferase n=1 Tax=Dinoroseobacter shibae (strain DSM 16493 / NCIMB 14021 / DFL 12) TaxID=398580 RepID=A8LPZ9_DINSH|nr:carbon-nitrogen hydrolase family protein [Dinoroseobacter shibae]ABV95239.1 nitrilase/cyanide hydratase and apolipoprotein N-acyltransferase [Dinoroseobacter shibae DFL 12 = DSM 16493]URF46649.1 carbon-nitrogen hydrolase family protein [Dinoroseobacter shibae]URF50955.1 carbon-nitrogen hydrolase family protein [Dinoroseobacter shibae]